ncbi:MAG: hypothetical protein LBC58_04310 [Clostridiales Family XIII bacterium]|jgi:hypothetical protein|nr:hypothetical protein [Clostridiales Family XIII bacterium]
MEEGVNNMIATLIDFGIQPETISKATGIDEGRIEELFKGNDIFPTLERPEVARLHYILAMLHIIPELDPDEYAREIGLILMRDNHISLETLSKYSGIEKNLISGYLEGNYIVSDYDKFKFTSRVQLLHLILNFSQRDSIE